MYETYQILIDDPASELALGFDDYVASLAEIVRLSRPQFAVGIFGQWGSGKTTLMRGIERDLRLHHEIVPIWFNAWRYEKEEHLIIPLLDTLREQVLEWAERSVLSIDTSGARPIAAAIGRAAKAILAGLSLQIGLPGAVALSLDANKMATQWGSRGADDSTAYEPKSFYHASFMALESAVEMFLRPPPLPLGAPVDPVPKVSRFVVFIDDLDRCVPTKALEVLESMKLFFDLEGFVFVVGLDQRIIQQAVQIKYPTNTTNPTDEGASYVSGADYVKKIFQVQFAVPRVDGVQLPAYIHAIGGSELPPQQVADLQAVLTPMAGDLVGTSPVNPREVKRLVNAYTMQLKMLERKLSQMEPPNAVAIMALQIFAFRADWERAYLALSTDPIAFVDGARQAILNNESAIAVAADVIELPLSLLSFLQGNGACILTLDDKVELYLSAMEAVRTTDPTLREIAQTLGSLRVAHSAGIEKLAEVHDRLAEIAQRLASSMSSPDSLNIAGLLADLQARFPQGSDPGSTEAKDWLSRVGIALPRIAQAVADLQRRSVTAGSSVR